MKCVNLLFLISLFMSIVGSCQTDGNGPEIDADFVWRVCNQSNTFALQGVTAYGPGDISQDSMKIGDVAPAKCSSYNEGLQDGKEPIWWLGFTQNDEEYLITYLDAFQVVRGLADSTSVRQTPGKYTYHCIYDSKGEPIWGPKYGPAWVEVERDKYH